MVERVEVLRSMVDSHMEAEGWESGDLIDTHALQSALQVLYPIPRYRTIIRVLLRNSGVDSRQANGPLMWCSMLFCLRVIPMEIVVESK